MPDVWLMYAFSVVFADVVFHKSSEARSAIPDSPTCFDYNYPSQALGQGYYPRNLLMKLHPYGTKPYGDLWTSDLYRIDVPPGFEVTLYAAGRDPILKQYGDHVTLPSGTHCE
jgi:hypothetical protein